ncbi:MAG: tyrosine-type recombinase/integrase [Coprococcus phoceensis]
MYVLHKPWDPTQLPMRKFDSYLPFVPTQKEADIFISTLSDLKPKAMISLMYSAGLRVGEVCNLRYRDIERKNMRIHVAHSKNRSDRYAILSEKAMDILTRYWFAYGRPTGWLFPKQTDPSRPNGTKLRLIKRLLYYSKNSIEVFFSTIFIKQLTSIQKYAAALATDMII